MNEGTCYARDEAVLVWTSIKVASDLSEFGYVPQVYFDVHPIVKQELRFSVQTACVLADNHVRLSPKL